MIKHGIIRSKKSLIPTDIINFKSFSLSEIKYNPIGAYYFNILTHLIAGAVFCVTLELLSHESLNVRIKVRLQIVAYFVA